MNYSNATKILLHKSIQHSSNKTLFYFFKKLPNINKYIAFKLIKKLGLSLKTRLNYINELKKNAMFEFIDYEGTDAYVFKRTVTESKNKHKHLNTYKSKRRRLNLPTNGQRTRSNAKTTKCHNSP